MTLDNASEDLSAIHVEVINPETPFGGVQIFGATDAPLQVEFNTGSPVLSVFGRIGNILPQCGDYDQCYAPLEAAVPPGGNAGQVLKKAGDASFDTFWADAIEIGTVSNVSAGDLSPLFETDVADPTTTPSITFSLTNAPAHSFFGNNGGSLGAPAYHQIDFTDLSGFCATSQGGIPTGGTTGQALMKVDNTDYNTNWVDIPPGVAPADPTALVGLTPIDGVAATFMRSDAAPALDVGISPTWSGTHTFDNNITVPLVPVDPGHATSKAYVEALIVPTGSRLLTGGGVAWTRVGLDFIVSAATYLINGDFFTSPETPITLAPADPSLARIDVFAVDNTGSAVVITGIPGGPPLEPSVDPASQLRLTSVLVPAGSTTPSLTVENLYLENTEWTSSTNSPGTINLASTNNPYQGTKDIEATAAASGNYVTLVKPSGTLKPSDYTVLELHIRSKAAWPSPKNLTIFWMNGSTNVGLSVTARSMGFDPSVIGSYQQIVIPTAMFGTGALPIDRLRIAVSGGGGTIGFYIDNIILQAGGGGGGGGTGTVTNFTAGNLSPLFTTTVTDPSTTPALTFSLTDAGAHEYFGNNTGSTGAPGFHQIAYSELSGTPTIPSDLSALHFVTTQAEGLLSNEFSLGSLSSGILRHTVSAGVSTPAIVTIGSGLSFDGTTLTATGGAQAPKGVAFSSSRTTGIPTGKLTGYFTFEYAGTITGWNISIGATDVGTVTLKFWKIADGTAVPTVANVINTSGIQLTTGTHIRSTATGDFTTTAISIGDIIAVEVTAVTGTITELSGALKVTPT